MTLKLILCVNFWQISEMINWVYFYVDVTLPDNYNDTSSSFYIKIRLTDNYNDMSSYLLYQRQIDGQLWWFVEFTLWSIHLFDYIISPSFSHRKCFSANSRIEFFLSLSPISPSLIDYIYARDSIKHYIILISQLFLIIWQLLLLLFIFLLQ